MTRGVWTCMNHQPAKRSILFLRAKGAAWPVLGNLPLLLHVLMMLASSFSAPADSSPELRI